MTTRCELVSAVDNRGVARFPFFTCYFGTNIKSKNKKEDKMARSIKGSAGVGATGTVRTHCIHPSQHVRDKHNNHKDKQFKANNRSRFYRIGEGVRNIDRKDKKCFISGIMGLCIAAIGGLVYSFAGKVIVGRKRSMIVIPFIIVVSLFVLTIIVNTVPMMIAEDMMQVLTSTKHANMAAAYSFDILNPEWPLEPPIVKKDCKVMFKNDEMSLCHITPWANFGDELGPPVVKRILELHFNCSADDLAVSNLRDIYGGGGDNGFLNRTGTKIDTCLMAVGSLWRMLKSGDHIWGTGAAYSKTIEQRCLGRRIEKVANITVYSSRGSNSAKEIGKYCSLNKAHHLNSTTGEEEVAIEGAGDAGFLVPFIFPEYKAVKEDAAVIAAKEKCIIPHKKDEGNREWKNTSQNTKKLTVGIGWVNMTLALQTCGEVVSSSLHGIILSEAFGIASRRLRLSGAPGDFKFNDFYSSLRGSEPHKVGKIEEAFATISQPLNLNDLEEYAKRVLKTFPIHLFHAVGLASEAKEISASQ